MVIARLERRTGITLSGLVLAGFIVLGYGGARLLSARGLYLIVYTGVVILAVAVGLARRRRALTARRSRLPHVFQLPTRSWRRPQPNSRGALRPAPTRSPS